MGRAVRLRRLRTALLLSATCAGAAATYASSAWAASAPGAAPETGPRAPAPSPEEGIARDAAEDLRTGHWLFSVGGAVVAPSDRLTGVTGELGEPSVGGALRGLVGVGVSRHTLLRLDGGGSWLAGGGLCAECSAASYDVGLGVSYFLAQGVAFDPWIGVGVGYRYGLADRDDLSETTHGLDFLRLSLGGDFFPLALLGFGPFVEADVGVQLSAEEQIYGTFLAGLRVTLDPLRSGAELSPAVASR